MIMCSTQNFLPQFASHKVPLRLLVVSAGKNSLGPQRMFPGAPDSDSGMQPVKWKRVALLRKDWKCTVHSAGPETPQARIASTSRIVLDPRNPVFGCNLFPFIKDESSIVPACRDGK